MVGATAVTPVPATAKKYNNRAIADVTLPSAESVREHTYPIVLFGDDYTECNGFLSEMNPVCAPAASSSKRTANVDSRTRVLLVPSSSSSITITLGAE